MERRVSKPFGFLKFRPQRSNHPWHGEATKGIPRHVRERCPSLPWSEMAGMRDKLIHAYFGINRAII
ncbi:MAG: hypothetical protein CVV35_11980 [Methanomicrobiales archaeon HGW-Methanomicrobiales-6]|jgi:hypothetical protein|nr:MAG: hypothetical protein CVV35_11980 [Methanomicrobiales archaeon HGW-Methanomicrobiales-6]